MKAVELEVTLSHGRTAITTELALAHWKHYVWWESMLETYIEVLYFGEYAD
jgi:hypothetical protein